MQFELTTVQLDDITRLENIINEHALRLEQLEWNANDRFDHATKLTSAWENELQFRNLSPSDHSILSDNNRTIKCKIQLQNAPVQLTNTASSYSYWSDFTRKYYFIFWFYFRFCDRHNKASSIDSKSRFSSVHQQTLSIDSI